LGRAGRREGARQREQHDLLAAEQFFGGDGARAVLGHVHELGRRNLVTNLDHSYFLLAIRGREIERAGHWPSARRSATPAPYWGGRSLSTIWQAILLPRFSHSRRVIWRTMDRRAALHSPH